VADAPVEGQRIEGAEEQRDGLIVDGLWLIDGGEELVNSEIEHTPLLL
jgi:hypothetical protein